MEGSTTERGTREPDKLVDQQDQLWNFATLLGGQLSNRSFEHDPTPLL